MDFLKRSKHSNHEQIVEPQTKRISTPAGQRLSTILESGKSKDGTTVTVATKTRESHRASVRQSGLSAVGLGNAPRESLEEESPNGSGYSFSVWSESGPEKFNRLRPRKNFGFFKSGDGTRSSKKWGWKRIVIIMAIMVACVVAVAVGLAFGLKKKSSSSSNSSNDSQSTTDDSKPASPTSTLIPSTLPANFPVGTFSLVTFLDTVITECTSNDSTWSCYPYTDYYSSPSGAFSTFNWAISGSAGAYKISSTGKNDFGIEFQNQELELLDEGKSSERYRFQLSETRKVDVKNGLSEPATCEFQGTSLQAFLYTKMERTYPSDSVSHPEVSNPWPFAVRVEETVGGGENVPSCKSSSGKQITDGITPQDASKLCSCLYKNWNTPK